MFYLDIQIIQTKIPKSFGASFTKPFTLAYSPNITRASDTSELKCDIKVNLEIGVRVLRVKGDMYISITTQH